MLEHAIIISLQITAIHIAFSEGNILHWFRTLLATMLDKLKRPLVKIYVLKPITDCLPCMASLWTIILTRSFSWQLMLCVCGFNFIISNLFLHEPDPAE